MYCPRLDHFVRLNADHTIGKCGHMTSAPGFDSYEAMQNSDWLREIRQKMDREIWPKECQRCCQIETLGKNSVRQNALVRHQVLSKIRSDYLILSGVLDNICNSACQSCNPNLSTKIGSLYEKTYIKINNSDLLDNVPWPRIVEVDVNGGEPTASANYHKLIEKLPDSIKVLRVNTNGSKVLSDIESLLQKNIQVIITLSLDGIDRIHDYVRWPIQWRDYTITVDRYQKLKQQYKNLRLQTWTVVHALNIRDFANIRSWADRQGLEHSWAYLHEPSAIDVKYHNSWTAPYRDFDPQTVATKDDNQGVIEKFIEAQDKLRGINIRDYL